MTETTPGTAPTPNKETPAKPGAKRGFPGGRGPGRPKGSRDRRYIAGQAAAQALEHRAWDVVAALLTCSSWRARHEAAKTVLSYSLGMPRQMLTIEGGLSDFAAELGAALAEMRLRRSALDAGLPVAGLVGLPLALPAPPGDEVPAPEAPVPGETEVEP
jgi:hypothetical protein